MHLTQQNAVRHCKEILIAEPPIHHLVSLSTILFKENCPYLWSVRPGVGSLSHRCIYDWSDFFHTQCSWSPGSLYWLGLRWYGVSERTVPLLYLLISEHDLCSFCIIQSLGDTWTFTSLQVSKLILLAGSGNLQNSLVLFSIHNDGLYILQFFRLVYHTYSKINRCSSHRLFLVTQRTANQEII